MSQQVIDKSNAEFWDTLCGSALARSVGITGESEDDLRRFDELYFGHYPYLSPYVDREELQGKKILEIGLGFGTLGQLLASKGSEYHGIDIAAGPVSMMRRRLEALGLPEGLVQQASVLELPFPEGMFDYVYSIGCLHHTGDLPRSVAEVHRVLAPGGRAVVMLYHGRSLRRVAYRLRDAATPARRQQAAERMRALYDADEAGTPAPHTDFVSRREVRRLFGAFDRVHIDVQNFDGFRFGLRREWCLSNLARVVGLDLYIVADKRG